MYGQMSHNKSQHNKMPSTSDLWMMTSNGHTPVTAEVPWLDSVYHRVSPILTQNLCDRVLFDSMPTQSANQLGLMNTAQLTQQGHSLPWAGRVAFTFLAWFYGLPITHEVLSTIIIQLSNTAIRLKSVWLGIASY